MDFGHVNLSKGRDLFSFRAPREILCGLIDPPPHGCAPGAILSLQRCDREVRALRVDGAATRVIPYPHAHRALMRSLAGPARAEPHVSLQMLLPRRTFDQLADRHGAARMKRLDLEAGIAGNDTVMSHLAACLEHALAAAEPALADVVDQITASVTLHIAQRYGGLQPGRSSQRGGLAAWQLRRVRASFDRRLDGPVSLDDVARECGLSVSHFSRSFRRSMGLAPHRWLIRRRVEVAKDLMLAEPMPLAQVALACGFADQSHFTRTFASLTGLTPARWRTQQEREFALG